MKLNKIQFKKILKECIRELIVEGAFNNVIKENVETEYPNRRPAANDFVPNPREVGTQTPNDRLKEIAKIAAQDASKGDPKSAAMMASIFEDTARTTLQSQMGAEGKGGGGDVYTGNPEEEQKEMKTLDALSGGRGVSHWATVAFGKKT